MATCWCSKGAKGWHNRVIGGKNTHPKHIEYMTSYNTRQKDDAHGKSKLTPSLTEDGNDDGNDDGSGGGGGGGWR